MTIAHGATAEMTPVQTGTLNTFTIAQPASSRGILVSLFQALDSNDIVTTVTVDNGGAPVGLTRVRTDFDATSGETMRTYLYLIGAAIPAGTLTVKVNRSNGTAQMWGSASFQTGAANIEVVDSDGIGDNVLGPTVTLQKGGRPCLSYAILGTGLNGLAQWGLGSGLTALNDEDVTDVTVRAVRETTVGTNDFTVSWTGNLLSVSDDLAFSAVTLSEVGSGGVSAVQSTFLCRGCEAKPGGTHWHGEVGAMAVSQTAIARNGGRALLFTPTNDVSHRYRNIARAKSWFRGFLKFASLPSGDCELLRFRMAGSGASSPMLVYRASDQSIRGVVGTASTSTQTVAVGGDYLINVAGDASTGTRTMKLTVGGADKGTASLAVAAGTFDRSEVGASIVTPVNASVMWQDMRFGEDVTLYPVADGTVIELDLTSDGTHVYDAANDFQYNNSVDIGLGATLTKNQLVGPLTDIGQWLSAPGASFGTEYLEWILGGMPAATSIAAVEVLLLPRGPNTTPHGQTAKIVDGATVQDLYTAQSYADPTGIVFSKHFQLAPSGVAWTQALLNALKFRWYRDSGVPGLAGLRAEVEYVPTPLATVNQRNPLYTYGSAGVKTVTLTVTSDDGATATVTHQITVP